MPGRFLVGVAGLIVRDGALLLLKRAAGKRVWPGEWAPVTGLLEDGESFEAGLKREVREETRLTVAVEPDPIGTWHLAAGPYPEPLVGVTFVCTAQPGRVLLADEHDAQQWVPLKDAAAFAVVAPVRPMVERLLALHAIAAGLRR